MRTFATVNGRRLLLVAVAVLCLGTTAATASRQASPAGPKYTIASTWGSLGSSPGQFKGASGIGIDSQGAVYIADGANNRVEKFDADGKFLTTWGSYGPGPGQFSNPVDVAVDGAGNVWVSEQGNSRIQRFTTSGGNPTDGKLTNIPVTGGTPDTIAVDGAGNVFASGFLANRVQRFDSSSNWGLGVTWGSAGKSAGQLNNPRGIAASPDGTIFVGDRDNYRVERFDPAGKLLNVWGTNGTNPGQFREPQGIAVDRDCNVWVADSTAHRLQKFDPGGKLLAVIQNNESDLDVAVGPNGDIYVLEINLASSNGAQQVQRFHEVPAPGPQIANVPASLHVLYDKKTKTFYVAVPYRVSNIGCPDPLPAVATLKTAKSKTLGTQAGAKLALFHPTTIIIPVTKAAILGAGFKTVGGNVKVTTHLTVVLKTNGRDTITVKNGTLSMSVKAIKSGALPGLTALTRKK